MKHWLKKKSFSNWLLVLMGYLIIVSIITGAMLAGDLVRQVKQLEATCTEYQNTVNMNLNTIHLLQELQK